MRYFIKFQYDGSKFYGFQRQKDKKTVQGEIERALYIIHKKVTELKGAGRTDIGVHANGQCAHFDFDYEIPDMRLKRALNNIIHPYIHILECKKVDSEFHARFCAKGKKYLYKIWLGEYDPTLYDYYYIYDRKMDVNKLKACAAVFIGKHDFHNFVSGARTNYKNEIYEITVKKEGQLLQITFYGKSFYRYMVRNLMGAMIDYNENRCTIYDIMDMVNKKDYDAQLSCAPASGLYLEEVLYEENRK